MRNEPEFEQEAKGWGRAVIVGFSILAGICVALLLASAFGVRLWW